MKKATDGYEIKVGDIIKTEHVFGKKTYSVHRVTKKYAFVKYNDVAEGKFPRIYDSFWFSSLPRQAYNTTKYSLFINE